MNKINFIFDQFPEIEMLTGVLSPSVVSININEQERLKSNDLFKIHSQDFYKNEFCNFSFFLNFSENTTSNKNIIHEIIDKKDLLLQYFFHPNFEKFDNKPVLFLNYCKDENNLIPSFINELNGYFYLQGFVGIHFVCLNNSEIINEPNIQYIQKFKDSITFENGYFEKISKDFYCGKYFSILNANSSQISDVLISKRAAEKKLHELSSKQYNIQKKHSENLWEIYFLTNETKYLKEDLVNQKKYLEIFKSLDESKKINEFYYNEYEILPLWYKKLGHILKVFIGKRSFRSLFDNDVKKYKN